MSSTRTLKIPAIILLVCLGQLSIAANVQRAYGQSLARNETAAEVFVATILSKDGLDENGLPIMLRLPVKVRQHVVGAVWRLNRRGVPDEACERVTLYVLKNDPAAYYRGHAASYLWRCKGPKVVAALTEALKDQDQYVRNQACSSLGYHADPKTIDAIIPLLDDESHHCRNEAVTALGKLKAKKALPKIRKLWQKAGNSDNYRFARTFAQIGDTETALKACAKLLDSPGSGSRGMAAQILRSVNDKNAAVTLMMKHIPREMEIELTDWSKRYVRGGDVMERLGYTLAKHTGQRFSADPQFWLDWWEKNHADFGARDYSPPKNFVALLKRYHAPRVLPEKLRGPHHNTQLEFTNVEPDAKTVWSETVNGWRARLIPFRRHLDRGEDAYFALVFQNMSDKAQQAPQIQFSHRLIHPRLVNKNERRVTQSSKTVRSLSPIEPASTYTAIVHLSIPDNREGPKARMAIADSKQPRDVIYEDVQLAHRLPAGRYNLRVLFNGAGPRWNARRIVTPPVSIEVDD